MIEFFRDILDGPLYIITTILSIVFIMAIIGFLMERKKLEKEEKEKIAVVSISNDISPIKPVEVEKIVEEKNIISNEQISNSNFEPEKTTNEVKPSIINFEDKEQKTE